VDLAELVRAAGRRWYVLVAGLVLTAGLVLLVLRFVPPSYNVQTSVLLLPPISSVEPISSVKKHPVNPFLNLGGLDVVGGVLSKAVTDSESVRSIVRDGSQAKYTVEPDATVAGSVLAVTVSDSSPAGAFRTLDAILKLTTTRLQTLQNSVGATGDSQVRLMVITKNSVAELDVASLVRTLIVVIAAGVVLTLLLAVSIDALVRRRKRRNAVGADAAAAPEVSEVPEAPAAPQSVGHLPDVIPFEHSDSALVHDSR
jgi:hypothetical protein